jgi:hypothetical protein
MHKYNNRIVKAPERGLFIPRPPQEATTHPFNEENNEYRDVIVSASERMGAYSQIGRIDYMDESDPPMKRPTGTTIAVNYKGWEVLVDWGEEITSVFSHETEPRYIPFYNGAGGWSVKDNLWMVENSEGNSWWDDNSEDNDLSCPMVVNTSTFLRMGNFLDETAEKEYNRVFIEKQPKVQTWHIQDLCGLMRGGFEWITWQGEEYET